MPISIRHFSSCNCFAAVVPSFTRSRVRRGVSPTTPQATRRASPSVWLNLSASNLNAVSPLAFGSPRPISIESHEGREEPVTHVLTGLCTEFAVRSIFDPRAASGTVALDCMQAHTVRRARAHCMEGSTFDGNFHRRRLFSAAPGHRHRPRPRRRQRHRHRPCRCRPCLPNSARRRSLSALSLPPCCAFSSRLIHSSAASDPWAAPRRRHPAFVGVLEDVARTAHLPGRGAGSHGSAFRDRTTTKTGRSPAKRPARRLVRPPCRS